MLDPESRHNVLEPRWSVMTGRRLLRLAHGKVSLVGDVKSKAHHPRGSRKSGHDKSTFLDGVGGGEGDGIGPAPGNGGGGEDADSSCTTGSEGECF